jgi:simple sugar transport system ATP-binding protein
LQNDPSQQEKYNYSKERVFCEVKDLTKIFPSVVALDHVGLKIRASGMHALVGENGAGKTTLMRILMGLYTPNEGDIFWQGQKVRFTSPEDAIDKGLMMVSQHSSLIEMFNALKNLAIVKDFATSKIPQLKLIAEELQKTSEKIGCRLEFERSVESLSYEDRQRVEITRALTCKLNMLILDEATSMLTPEESHYLLRVLHSMARKGLPILYSSHKLDEVMGYADEITVLRQGKVIVSELREHLTENELAKAVAGEETIPISKPEYAFDPANTQYMLVMKDVWCKGEKGRTGLKGVSLQVNKGEILGVAGSSLSGKRELAETIMNKRKLEKGTVEIATTKIIHHQNVYDLGVSYVPEGAHSTGIVPDFSVMENVLLTRLDDRQFFNGRFLNSKSLREVAEKVVKEFDVKTPSVDVPAKVLSGGNIQKLVVGREFSKPNLKLLIAVNPTTGLDIKTCHRIWQKIIELREKGSGIILISEDLNELKQLSDRIVVLYEGSVLGPFLPTKLEISDIGSIMLDGKCGSE